MKAQATIPNEWYAIYTKSRFEKKIHATISKLGVESFLPLIKEKRLWTDRIKAVEVPLLPSYVFVKTTKLKFPLIYSVPGFVRFVSFEGKLSVILEKEIELLHTIITNGYSAKCCNYNTGDLVRIIHGPLKGWEGRVENRLGNSRVVFNVNSINQGLSIEVPLDNIQRVEMSGLSY